MEMHCNICNAQVAEMWKSNKAERNKQKNVSIFRKFILQKYGERANKTEINVNAFHFVVCQVCQLLQQIIHTYIHTHHYNPNQLLVIKLNEIQFNTIVPMIMVAPNWL